MIIVRAKFDILEHATFAFRFARLVRFVVTFLLLDFSPLLLRLGIAHQEDGDDQGGEEHPAAELPGHGECLHG